MIQPNDNHVKIHYLFYSTTLEQDITETMWAIPVNIRKGLYRLISIPFYAKSLALGDIIYTLYDDSRQALVLEDVVEFSGHSTIQIVLMADQIQTEDIIAVFRGLGCGIEKQIDRYFAIDIPDTLNYNPIKKKLQELQTQGFIDFAEACLSSQHASND